MNCRLTAPTTLLFTAQLILLAACGTDLASEGDWGGGPDAAPDVAAEESCTTATECDDGNPCTEDLCASDGLCKHIPLTGTACDDSNECTGDDQCDASGQCAGSVAVPRRWHPLHFLCLRAGRMHTSRGQRRTALRRLEFLLDRHHLSAGSLWRRFGDGL